MEAAESSSAVEATASVEIELMRKEIQLLKEQNDMLQKQLELARCKPDSSSQQGSDLANELEACANSVLTKQSLFVFEPSSNLYYHTPTGFYFNDKTCLFWDATNERQYKFNARTEKLVRVSVKEDGEVLSDEEVPSEQKPESEEASAQSYVYDEQSGMYFDSHSGYYYDANTQLFYEPTSQKYFRFDAETQTHVEVPSPVVETPEESKSSSLRLIVTESDVISRATLFVVTCLEEDAVVGSCTSCAVRIPDPQHVANYNCKLRYNEESNSWRIRLVNSTCKAKLNGRPLTSKWTPLVHGLPLEVGQTTLSVHVHDGSETCDACEPALVQAFYEKRRRLEESNAASTLLRNNKERERRITNDKLKGELGLKGRVPNVAMNYKDRAGERRKQTKESTNSRAAASMTAPSLSSSVHEPIDRGNMGYKLLAKQGYKDGQGLGRNQDGVSEAPKVKIYQPGSGLQSGGPTFSIDQAQVADRYYKQWSKAAERFAKLS